MTVEELKKIAADKAEIINVRRIVREQAEKLASRTGYRKQVLVCGVAGCQSSHSLQVLEQVEKSVKELALDDVLVIKTGCFGLCALGPIMVVYPEGAFYTNITPEKAERIAKEHLVKGGNPVKEYLYADTLDKNGDIIPVSQTPFYKYQLRIALRNCGVINPESIDEAIGAGDYAALTRALFEMTPDGVIEEIEKSGLRGRGGAGFPTGRKWRFTKMAQGDVKYVVCNADEGDPGAFMDRSVLEGDPHTVLEAMAIAGYAVGANEGYVYVRAEYPGAIESLNRAISQAREYGLLGKNILGSGFDFDIHVRLGAGAFVCGEETALMQSIEGKRGEPRPRPPFSAQSGLFKKPTVLNNVETWANISPIILNGFHWFSSIGTEKSKGTKVFAVGGKINNVGLVEVPMGTPLKTIIYDIGGGIPHGKAFKAAQTGGPSGGCIPAKYIDIEMDFDNLVAIGSMMGSGGLIVMDEDTCMVDIAKFYLEFTADESCGKCTPCRIGTKRLLEILDRICNGKGEPDDIAKIKDIAGHMQSSSLCALGQSAPNPVLSTMEHYADEYEAHIFDKKCPAGVCKSLLNYYIDPDICRGCTLCARNCPANAITGAVKSTHVIDTTKCIKCGQCIAHCKFNAIVKK